MSLSRKMLKAMGIEEEKIDQIIEAHAETVDGLKTDLEKYKGDAEKLPVVQKELDDLKAKGDDGWKEKHDSVKREFDEYKADIANKEAKAEKESAVRSYFESKNIKGANLNIAMRSSASEINAVEVENGKIKDTSALDALIAGDYAGLVTSQTVRFDMNGRLDHQEKPLTKEDIMSIKDGATRRKAMLDNPSLFGLDKNK